MRRKKKNSFDDQAIKTIDRSKGRIYSYRLFSSKNDVFFVTKEKNKYLDRIKLIHEQNKGSYIRSINHLKENLQQTSED
jgi:hypothetical protein